MDGWIDDGMNDRRRMWGMYYDLMMEMALVVTALCVRDELQLLFVE